MLNIGIVFGKFPESFGKEEKNNLSQLLVGSGGETQGEMQNQMTSKYTGIDEELCVRCEMTLSARFIYLL